MMHDSNTFYLRAGGGGGASMFIALQIAKTYITYHHKLHKHF